MRESVLALIWLPVSYYESDRNHLRNDGTWRSARQWFKGTFHCWEIVDHECALLSGMQGGYRHVRA